MADFNSIPILTLPAVISSIPISGATLPWNGTSVPYQWTVTLNITPQTTSSTTTRVALQYTGLDINIGMWLGDIVNGIAWQIISITSKTDTSVVCVIQDIFRYNTYRDPTSTGNGGPATGAFVVFQLAEDGTPMLDNVPTTASPLFFSSIIARFSYIESQCDYPLNQPGFATVSFNYNDIIAIDQATQTFVLADAAHEQTTIGRIIAVDDTLTTFAIDPVRKVIDDFTYLPGTVGSVLYVDNANPGKLTTTSTGGGAATFIKIRNNGQSNTISSTFGSPSSYVTTTGSVFTVNNVSATVAAAAGSGPISTGSPYSGIVTGTGYTAGIYTNVALTGGFGTGAQATIGVSAGKVHSITFTAYGSGYHQGDVLSAPSSSLGGTGSGFQVTVNISSTLTDVMNAINSVSTQSGVTATMTGTGPYYITSTAVDARAINFVDLNGSVTTDVGLISVQNGGTGAAMYVALPGVASASSAVTSFNTRTGAVTLTSTDVVDALGVQAPYTVFAGPGTGSVSSFSVVAPGAGYTNGTYSAVPLVTVTGSGIGATANITVTGGGNVSTVTTVAAGSGYAAGDTVTVTPSSLGGGSGFGTTLGTLPNPSNAFYWEGIAWNGSIWLAVASNTGNNVTYPIGSGTTAISTDGVNWTLHANVIPNGGGFLNPAWTGSLFIELSSSSPGYASAWTSPDGITWTTHALSSAHWWTDWTWNGTTFCAVSSGANNVGSRTTLTTNDGITWSVNTNALPAAGLWQTVAAGNGRFVALQFYALNGTSPTNIAATSTDGVTWTTITLPVSANWLSLAWNGSVFVALSDSNTNIGAYSSTGLTWTSMTLPSTQYWIFLGTSGSTFVAEAYNTTTGAISTDGISWTSQTLAYANLRTSGNGPSNTAIFTTITGQTITTNTSSTVTPFYGSAVLSLTSALPVFRALVAADIPTLDDGIF